MKSDRFKNILGFILTIFVGLASSQSLAHEYWEKTFGGSSSDQGHSVQQTTDGGYIITGFTFSFGAGDSDVYLIKTDTAGNEVWSKTFGGSDYDAGSSVQQTTDGGYIIAGYTTSFGAGGNDVYLIKADTAGNEVWSKTFGGSGSDQGFSVEETIDGGYIIAGSTSSFSFNDLDVYLIKTDAAGNEVWSKAFERSGKDNGSSVDQTTDGGFIIAGSTGYPTHGYVDVYLIKTDGAGNEVWSKTFDRNGEDYGYSVRQTTDGGYIIAGSSGISPNNLYLIKTDGGGNEVWSKAFGGSYSALGQSVQQTTDGGYIIAGRTRSFNAGNDDLYLIKTDGGGNEVWSKAFGGSDSAFGSSVQQTTDGGYIIAGYTTAESDICDVYLTYYNPADSLSNALPLTGLCDSQGSMRYYRIEVPEGASNIEIKTFGGTGDCDLYVKYGSAATSTFWDFRPYLWGNDESVICDNPPAGWWYITLIGRTDYSDVTLVAQYMGADEYMPLSGDDGGGGGGCLIGTTAYGPLR